MSNLRRLTKALPKLAPIYSVRENHMHQYGYRGEQFHEHGYVKERHLTLRDRLQGLKEEREAETTLWGKAFNAVCDIGYKHMYKNKINWVFPREFYGNPWMRYISVDGIPGSGAKKFAKDLAAERENIFAEKPDLYYFFKRHNQQCEAQKALTESFAAGELGNYYEEWLNMDWKKVHANPDDWQMASKCTAWQLRSMRLAEMDNAIDFLLGCNGVVAHQTYLSYRAEIHALGETNMFPDIMYQSFIDQYQNMMSRLMSIPTCFYLDVSPEEAYKNIQNDPNMSEDEKAFHTLDYLKAYQEGYEEFVIPQMEHLDVLVVRVTPGDIENLPYFCDNVVRDHPNLFHSHSHWDSQYLFKNGQYGRNRKNHKWPASYWVYVDNNMDIKDQARQGVKSTNKVTNVQFKPESGDRTIWGEKLIQWKYPLDVVDVGHDHDNGFGNDENWWYPDEVRNMRGVQKQALNRRGYGWRHGMNKGEESSSIWKILCHDNTERYANKQLAKTIFKPMSIIDQT